MSVIMVFCKAFVVFCIGNFDIVIKAYICFFTIQAMITN